MPKATKIIYTDSTRLLESVVKTLIHTYKKYLSLTINGVYCTDFYPRACCHSNFLSKYFFMLSFAIIPGVFQEVRRWLSKTVQDFLIKLGIKPRMHILEICKHFFTLSCHQNYEQSQQKLGPILETKVL